MFINNHPERRSKSFLCCNIYFLLLEYNINIGVYVVFHVETTKS